MKTWEGISVHKRIAHLDMRARCVLGTQQFKTCLRTVRDRAAVCRRQKCVIALLIERLRVRGASIPSDL